MFGLKNLIFLKFSCLAFVNGHTSQKIPPFVNLFNSFRKNGHVVKQVFIFFTREKVYLHLSENKKWSRNIWIKWIQNLKRKNRRNEINNKTKTKGTRKEIKIGPVLVIWCTRVAVSGYIGSWASALLRQRSEEAKKVGPFYRPSKRCDRRGSRSPIFIMLLFSDQNIDFFH